MEEEIYQALNLLTHCFINQSLLSEVGLQLRMEYTRAFLIFQSVPAKKAIGFPKIYTSDFEVPGSISNLCQLYFQTRQVPDIALSIMEAPICSAIGLLSEREHTKFGIRPKFYFQVFSEQKCTFSLSSYLIWFLKSRGRISLFVQA